LRRLFSKEGALLKGGGSPQRRRLFSKEEALLKGGGSSHRRRLSSRPINQPLPERRRRKGCV